MRAERQAASHTFKLTIVISTVTALVIGSMLYYTLKRHDLLHMQEVERMAGLVSEQKALAAGRVFAAMGPSIIRSDFAHLQELVETGQALEGVRDVMIVSRDNTVLAAKNRQQIGQRVLDSTWLYWKGQNREVAQRADQGGEPVFVIVEPLNDKDGTIAWAMLVFALPDTVASLRTPMERLGETGRLMAPIVVCLLLGIGLAMRFASTAIRKQIQGVMESVLGESTREEKVFRKAS